MTKLPKPTEAKQSSFTKCLPSFIFNTNSSNYSLGTRLQGSGRNCRYTMYWRASNTEEKNCTSFYTNYDSYKSICFESKDSVFSKCHLIINSGMDLMWKCGSWFVGLREAMLAFTLGNCIGLSWSFVAPKVLLGW